MTFNYPMFAVIGWVALAIGSALLERERTRRRAAAGLLCLGLGLAAWRASSTGAASPFSSPDRFGEGFLVVNGGLLLLGLGLVLWAAAANRPGGGLLARIAIILGAIFVMRLCAGLLLAAGLPQVVGSAAALGVTGAGLTALGRTVASSGPARALGRRLCSNPLPAVPPANRSALVTVGLAGAAATAVGPHVAMVFLGLIVVAWSAFLLFRPPGRRPAPVTPVLTLSLVPTYWLLATIAGPEGLSLSAFPLLPISPAAEHLIAPALLLAGWSLAGLWPLHRQVPGALVGLFGALLLIRIAMPLAPEGLEHWRPLAFPLLIAGMWHAGAHARWTLLAVGAGFLGIAGLTPLGVSGAAWLFGSALTLELCSIATLPGGVLRMVQVPAWTSALWGGLLVLEGGLRAEVVYTVFAAMGVALLVAPGRSQTTVAR